MLLHRRAARADNKTQKIARRRARKRRVGFIFVAVAHHPVRLVGFVGRTAYLQVSNTPPLDPNTQGTGSTSSIRIAPPCIMPHPFGAPLQGVRRSKLEKHRCTYVAPRLPFWASSSLYLVRVRPCHEEVGDGRPLVRSVLIQSRSLAVQGLAQLHNVGPRAVQVPCGREKLQSLWWWSVCFAQKGHSERRRWTGGRAGGRAEIRTSRKNDLNFTPTGGGGGGLVSTRANKTAREAPCLCWRDHRGPSLRQTHSWLAHHICMRYE